MSREEVLKKVRGFGFASEARTPISSKWTEVVAALDAFEAETRRKALEWQPIETAPQDGTEFLGYNREGRVAVAYRIQRDDCEMWRFGSTTAAISSYPNLKPTHWMPLPPAPKEST